MEGERNIYFPKTEENFSVDLPDVELKNIIMGTKYVYFNGIMRVSNKTNGDVLEITYPGIGWTGKKDF